MQSVEQVQETILTDDNSYQVIDKESPGVLDEIARIEKQLAEERWLPNSKTPPQSLVRLAPGSKARRGQLPVPRTTTQKPQALQVAKRAFYDVVSVFSFFPGVSLNQPLSFV